MTNQQHDAPLEYYRARFRALDPEEASRRTGLSFDPSQNRFTFKALGQTLYAKLPDFSIIKPGKGGQSNPKTKPDDIIMPEDLENCPNVLYNFEMQLLTMQFLLSGAAAPPGGRFMAYRELPWGEVYDANFQGRCIKRLANAFGNDPGKFAKAAEALGGVKQGLGDVSYDLPFLGGVICRLILWAPDDEFPASAQFLFSDNTRLSFNAEALAGVGDVVISALKEVSKRNDSNSGQEE